MGRRAPRLASGDDLHLSPARRGDVVDLHHGREIADPYRWLEDLDSNETADFVAAQNAVSGPYLPGFPTGPGSSSA